jgi:hypothetical protein
MNANGCQIEEIVMPPNAAWYLQTEVKTLKEDVKRYRQYLEMIRDIACHPTRNELETGFRHSPLTPREIAERMTEALDHIAILACESLKDQPDAQG